jgi:hypothetical protein
LCYCVLYIWPVLTEKVNRNNLLTGDDLSWASFSSLLSLRFICSLYQSDKRSSASSGSGFLSSFGKEVSKGLNTMMGDLRMSPKTSPRDVRNLRVASAPNMMARPVFGIMGGNSSTTSTSCGGSVQREAEAALGSGGAKGGSSPNVDRGRYEIAQPLPPGWEAKFDVINKRVFYVDHNSKTTTWERPAAMVVNCATPAEAFPPQLGVGRVGFGLPLGDVAGVQGGDMIGFNGSCGSKMALEGGSGSLATATPPKSHGQGCQRKGAPDGTTSESEGTGNVDICGSKSASTPGL